METIVKEIRDFLNIDQIEFSKQLKVTIEDINNWENDYEIPDKSIQLKLYDICKEKSVPIYDMTLKKIYSLSEKIDLKGNKILLYHGSKSGICGNIEPKSRIQCDFGKGFYMGTEPSQALTLICDYENSLFYILSVDMSKVIPLEVPVNIDWAMLVGFNRGRMEKIKGTSFYNKYRDMTKDKDLIIGSIANDRMFYVIDNFFIGNITDAALINSLSALQLGKQYVAVTQKGCDAVRIEYEVSISYLERLFMREHSEENRKKGISLANDICKNYRREGKFFDEILDEVKCE